MIPMVIRVMLFGGGVRGNEKKNDTERGRKRKKMNQVATFTDGFIEGQKPSVIADEQNPSVITEGFIDGQNPSGIKRTLEKHDEDTTSSSTVCERDGSSIKLKQRLEKEDEGRDEHQPAKGEDVDPLSVEMFTGETPYIAKTDLGRHIVEQMQTLVNHHSTYTSRIDKLDQEIVALQKLIRNQNMGDERVATDDEVEEEDNGDDGSEEKEGEQEEINLCLMARSIISESSMISDESECTKNRYYQLLNAFQELYDEVMKLQHLIIKFKSENKRLKDKIELGHATNSCYYKNSGVPKGKFKWIPKEPLTSPNMKGPKFKWVVASKPLNWFAGY
ncbi:hypothetical protein V8G54_018299 [Vigna mungo]|uniref:Uncharacterized protein n=1 Tax=Vigna mungo TaxID=3915 RepID=A0AAQ3RTU6_VIGMU